MSEADTLHPIDLEAKRFSIKRPEVRYDKQGERPDAERLAAAMKAFFESTLY